jgi:hypothetical protein
MHGTIHFNAIPELLCVVNRAHYLWNNNSSQSWQLGSNGDMVTDQSPNSAALFNLIYLNIKPADLNFIKLPILEKMAGVGDAVVYFRTEKGKDAITFRGHCYRHDRMGADGIFWRCSREGCRGRIMTDINRDNPVVRTEHNHPADFDSSKVREVRDKL